MASRKTSQEEPDYIARADKDYDPSVNRHSPHPCGSIVLNIEASYRRKWKGQEAYREL